VNARVDLGGRRGMKKRERGADGVVIRGWGGELSDRGSGGGVIRLWAGQ
jgi:hypothetical protein